MTANLLEKSSLVTDIERYNHAALLQAATRLVATRFGNVAIKIAFPWQYFIYKTACHLSEKQQQYLKIIFYRCKLFFTGC